MPWHCLCDRGWQNPMPVMININPHPGYALLRAVSAVIAFLALISVATGLAGNATVLAWAIAVIASSTFAASFYLKP